MQHQVTKYPPFLSIQYKKIYKNQEFIKHIDEKIMIIYIINIRNHKPY